MKRIKIFLSILIISAWAFSSCKKSSPAPAVFTPNISLKFNNTVFSSATPSAIYYAANTALQTTSSLQVIGTFSSTAVTSIIISGNIAVGTYNISGGKVFLTFSQGANLQNTFTGTSGTVVISTLTNNQITGTFQCTGVDQLNNTGAITSGQFSSTLSIQ